MCNFEVVDGIHVVAQNFSQGLSYGSAPTFVRTTYFYGIKGPLLNWIAAFLKDRHQSVVVEGDYAGQVPASRL